MPIGPFSQRLVAVHGVSCWNFGLSRRASLSCRATSWPDRRPEWHDRPPDQMMTVVMCSLDQGRQGSGAARAISGQMHQMQRDGALNSTIGTSSVTLATCLVPSPVSYAFGFPIHPRRRRIACISSHGPSQSTAGGTETEQDRGHPYRTCQAFHYCHSLAVRLATGLC